MSSTLADQQTNGTPSIAITGATGFIGKHLLESVTKNTDDEIRILTRRAFSTYIKHGLTFKGDLLDPQSIAEWIKPGCTVINLAYSYSAPDDENLSAAENLANACREHGIKRLIHCSTAAVTGRVPDTRVDESTSCNPIAPYEKTKFAIEQVFLNKSRGSYEVVIVRPTAVLGPGIKNLLKLANDLMHGPRITNYLRSCLFDRRTMNLVCVGNVTAAIQFLANTTTKVDREVFIISDDEYPENNFRDIERKLLALLEKRDYSMPRLPLPPAVLSSLLKLRNRSNINPYRVYDSSKLLRTGFIKPIALDDGLKTFVDWYKKTVLA